MAHGRWCPSKVVQRRPGLRRMRVVYPSGTLLGQYKHRRLKMELGVSKKKKNDGEV